MNENELNQTEWWDNRSNTVEENGPLTPSEHEELQLPKPAIITILLGLLMGIVVGILVCITRNIYLGAFFFTAISFGTFCGSYIFVILHRDAQKYKKAAILLSGVAIGTLLMIIITVLHITHTGSR